MEVIEKLTIDLTKITISPTIDRQHSELLIMVNNLIDQYHLINHRGKMAEILNRLTDYGQAHFKEEEKFMKEHNYPLIKEHVKSHQEYTFKIAFYNYKFFDTDAPQFSAIVYFIRNWWNIHLLKWDSHLVGLVKENPTK